VYEVDPAADPVAVGPSSSCKPQRSTSYYNGNQQIIYTFFNSVYRNMSFNVVVQLRLSQSSIFFQMPCYYC